MAAVAQVSRRSPRSRLARTPPFMDVSPNSGRDFTWTFCLDLHSVSVSKPVGHAHVGFPTSGSQGGNVWKFQGKGPARAKAGRSDSFSASATELLNVELGEKISMPEMLDLGVKAISKGAGSHGRF